MDTVKDLLKIWVNVNGFQTLLQVYFACFQFLISCSIIFGRSSSDSISFSEAKGHKVNYKITVYWPVQTTFQLIKNTSSSVFRFLLHSSTQIPTSFTVDTMSIHTAPLFIFVLKNLHNRKNPATCND